MTGVVTNHNSGSDVGCVPAIEVDSVVKTFGHVTALAGVSVAVYAGEVLGLLGDNGAGKSTLVSILSGVNQPDQGTIRVDGQSVVLESPARAQSLGIATVFQDLALVDQRDVASNLFLGREPTWFGLLVDRKRMIREAAAAVKRLGVNLPSVKTDVALLSGGQRQSVAVARTLLGGSRITLLDEPVAALGVRESQHVFQVVRKLKDEGHAVVLISHNIETVFELCDRAVVLRLGRKVADKAIISTSREELVDFIVRERAEALEERAEARGQRPGALELTRDTVRGQICPP